MKHLQLFEAWSSAFNRTLQDAYALAKERGQRHGRSTSRVLDYTRRNVSEDKFLVDDAAGNEYVFYIDPKFLLEPFKFLASSSSYDIKNYPFIPVVLESINGMSININDSGLTEAQILIREDHRSSEYKPMIIMKLPIEIESFFENNGKLSPSKYDEYLSKYPAKMSALTPILGSMRDKFSKVPQSILGYRYEVRFPKQKQLEDLLATYVQAIMSDPIQDHELSKMTSLLVSGSSRSKDLEAFMKIPSEGPTSSPIKNFFVSEIEKLKKFHPGYFM